MIKVKRVYGPPAPDDGFRILVDRLWARGLTKEKARIDLWLKGISPSNELRKWYGHDPEKWDEFKKRYFKEIGPLQEPIDLLLKKAKEGTITLRKIVVDLRDSRMIERRQDVGLALEVLQGDGAHLWIGRVVDHLLDGAQLGDVGKA